MGNEIRDMIAAVRKLRNQFGQLQNNVQQLQSSLTNVNRFIDDVNKDIAKWQFKSQPRLTRIQKLIDRLSENK
ncbi:hypothetical protein [Limosilactobacillus sp.]|uniref:hypothetical protein n=1 Tax=Limosilactobacillus sp. TaxID=2773925 RepID=UPI003F0651F5